MKKNKAAQFLGSLGGNATKKNKGLSFFKEISKAGVLARKNNRKVIHKDTLDQPLD